MVKVTTLNITHSQYMQHYRILGQVQLLCHVIAPTLLNSYTLNTSQSMALAQNIMSLTSEEHLHCGAIHNI